MVIGANGAPYIVLLNGGDITALGNTDRAVLNISANFLIRTADRLNQIAIGQGEEVGLEFEDVSSGTVTTTLEVLDASRVLAGACPAARNSGEFSQLAAPAVGPYAIAPLGRVPSPAKINLSATAAEQGTSTGWRACR